MEFKCPHDSSIRWQHLQLSIKPLFCLFGMQHLRMHPDHFGQNPRNCGSYTEAQCSYNICLAEHINVTHTVIYYPKPCSIIIIIPKYALFSLMDVVVLTCLLLVVYGIQSNSFSFDVYGFCTIYKSFDIISFLVRKSMLRVQRTEKVIS